MENSNSGLKGGASINHQIKIAYLTTNINNHLFFSTNRKFNNFVCSSETRIKVGKSKKEPDALIFNPNTEKYYIWIEICKKAKRDVKIDTDKIKLAFKELTDLKEGFIYIYETNEWLKYDKTKRTFIKSSKSSWLGVDLSKFLDTINCNT